MKILITGSNGFIGRNLKFYLQENTKSQILEFNREDQLENLKKMIGLSDFILHLAGENRPEKPEYFDRVNYGLTKYIIDNLLKKKRQTHIIFSSTTQVGLDNPYGKSKLKAEKALIELGKKTHHITSIMRLPGVFGKWCRPNYNSVVATFCHNIANDIPINISDENKQLKLLYIDHLLEWVLLLIRSNETEIYPEIPGTYDISIKSLADKINSYDNQRSKGFIQNIGSGFDKLLYATYVTYLPTNKFVYDLKSNEDKRGRFVEFMKNDSVGQLSYFTSSPGVSRGEHYHNSKVEKFLVLQGKARIKFKSLINDEVIEIVTDGEIPQVIETIPGWAHNIKNIGNIQLIVMVWANEVFDKINPDTYFREVKYE